MRHIIFGTAGHIDHGKTALVEALTGIDADRLEEEKLRGITIDLGFANLDFDDVQIGFVDVPGHEKFVKNMLAGAGGIDAVLLVVAADESIMPQTREHFDICRLLGIARGLVAVTKIDTVDEDLVGLVAEEVRDAVAGSFLQDAQILPVSARSGEGIEELKKCLRRIALDLPERAPGRIARLPVDRCFSMKGFGTVVTGTLISGSLRKDQEVEIIPGNRSSRIRGLQVHWKTSSHAVAGQRTAVNLQGVDRAEVERGMVLTVPGIYRATQIADVRLNLLPSAAPLKNLRKVRLHTGTTEVLARVALIGTDAVLPGESCYAQLRLDYPAFCLHGDPFIIRKFSPAVTIGGGRILHPQPIKHKATDEEALDRMKLLDTEDLPAKIPVFVETGHERVMSLSGLCRLLDEEAASLKQLCSGLAEKGRILLIPGPDPFLMLPETAETLHRATLSCVQAFHRDYPLQKGIPREELRKRLYDELPQEVFRHCLDTLAARNKIAIHEETVALHGREVQLSEHGQRLRASIEEAILKGGYQPPALPELLAAIEADPAEVRKIYFWMLREKILLRITEDLAYHRETLEEIKRTIRERLTPGARFGVADFKDLFDLTRKHAIPLLEYLDRERFTRRQGNERILL